MKTLIIMRGLPGSGKSTLAKLIRNSHKESGNSAVICSTDSYFCDENGVYKFNPARLGEYHNKNFLAAKLAMISGYDCVIVDNTNVKRRDFQKYVDVANERGYFVQFVTVGTFDENFVQTCFERNTHGVPIESIKRMAQNFEP